METLGTRIIYNPLSPPSLNINSTFIKEQKIIKSIFQVPYTPKEGKLIRDINMAWERLEKAEHERELALREELIRQV